MLAMILSVAFILVSFAPAANAAGVGGTAGQSMEQSRGDLFVPFNGNSQVTVTTPLVDIEVLQGTPYVEIPFFVEITRPGFTVLSWRLQLERFTALRDVGEGLTFNIIDVINTPVWLQLDSPSFPLNNLQNHQSPTNWHSGLANHNTGAFSVYGETTLVVRVHISEGAQAGDVMPFELLVNLAQNEGVPIPVINTGSGTITIISDDKPLHTVIFDINGGLRTGGGELSQTVENGGDAILPIVERAGHNFNGWTPVDAHLNVTENKTITAQWEPITWTVTFDLKGGELGSGELIQTIFDGENATQPTAEREGFYFVGWEPADAHVNVTSDRIIAAQWSEEEPETWQVVFDLNGGTLTSGTLVQTVEAGGDALPPVAVRTGHNFAGWQGEYTNVTEPRNIVAQWTPVSTAPSPPAATAPATTTPTVVLPIVEPEIERFFTQYHNAFLVGNPNGTIRPHDNVSRAEVATILFRLLNDEFRSQAWSQQNEFIDVNSGQWFNNAVSTMANAGILNGAGGGEFRPNDAITRAEFSAMVARFFSEFETSSRAFTDIEGNWAEDYINLIAEFGWVQGLGNGTFNPAGALTRAEVAAIIVRMLDRVISSTEGLLSGRTQWSDKTNLNAWYYLYMQEATHSTEFERLEDGTLRWTRILPHLDWTVLETVGSRPGGVVSARETQRGSAA